jgi:predicted nucleic acid-binding protein
MRLKNWKRGESIVMVGFDTGYFVRLLEGNETAVKVWQDLTEGNIDAVVSPLTFFELKRLALKKVRLITSHLNHFLKQLKVSVILFG